jgi:hypothetical protein
MFDILPVLLSNICYRVFWSLMSAFLLPIFTAVTCQSGMERSFSFNPVSCCAHTLLYMAIHDVLFFYMHFAMHKFQSLHLVYKYVHAMHHDAVHLMNGISQFLTHPLHIADVLQHMQLATPTLETISLQLEFPGPSGH